MEDGVKAVAGPGYWQVEYDLSKGVAPEPVWDPIELCATMEEAHERARRRAVMGQHTRVVYCPNGSLRAES